VASKSHLGRECFAALTAILQSEKLILPRSGEALTLRVSPRGFLKRQRGGDLRAAPTLIRSRGARGMREEYLARLRPISGIACGLGIVAIWLSVVWVLWNYLLSL